MTSTDLPGALPFPPDVAAQLEAATAAGPPRAHHLGSGGPRYTNRLALETSPYLRQHAHNPVAWWPWCDQAFEQARLTGRPVFLSVGYSTCHWCHVMERESFEDEEIARYLNEHFVAIKVDREERPDVDAIYMTAVQALTGSGGWPMSVFLRSDREPFYGGTYFPARDGDRGSSRGFLSILRDIAAVWQHDPTRVGNAAEALTGAVRVALAGDVDPGPAPRLHGAEPIVKAVRFFEGVFDQVHGGVSRAPKFPSNLPVRLLLRHHRRTKDPASLHMALHTLERMAAGGLMDQIGGGFHRYSTDAAWLVPHFEKMLYDNALLAVAYVEAWQATARRDLARIARQTLDYVLREMTSPEGAFYSATDADSEGEEGRFFVWRHDEIRALLGAEAEPFAAFYSVTPEGNFEGRNILWVREPDEDRWEAFAGARATLHAARERRPHPLRDEKIVAGWNALMISALAVAGRAFGERRYVDAAARAARFVLERMKPGGRLARTYQEATAPAAFLQDHAFLTQALLDVHEATFDPRWLEEALAIADATERLFGDPRGGWFVTGEDQEKLIAREKPTHDGAEPSGASVALLDVLRIESFTGDPRWRRIAESALRWYAPALSEQPVALTEMLLAVDALTDSGREVVLVWADDEGAPDAMLDVLRRTFLPNHVLTGAADGEALRRLGRVTPLAEGRSTIGGQPTAYVCERGACQLPATTPETLREQLEPVRPYP